MEWTNNKQEKKTALSIKVFATIAPMLDSKGEIRNFFAVEREIDDLERFEEEKARLSKIEDIERGKNVTEAIEFSKNKISNKKRAFVANSPSLENPLNVISVLIQDVSLFTIGAINEVYKGF